MRESSIEPLTVDNVPFLVDRLHRDCSSGQYIRELVKNSLEAVATAQQKGLICQGEICLDYDDYHYKRYGVKKFCVSDNGVGMAPDELEQFINHLSSSGKGQSLDGNYGIGAKIATIPANPHGVIYESWQHGKGYSVKAIRTPDGHYGLERRISHDGRHSTVMPLDDSYRPAIGPDVCIGANGTCVVLLGKTADEDTFMPPAGFGPLSSGWLSSYLNGRLFDLPPNVSIRVRECINGSDQYRGVSGMKVILHKYATNSGTVQLCNAKAHWWIMPTGQPGQPAGHTAILYQNELYDKAERRGIAARLQQFGISFGFERIILYVEPDPSQLDLTTNASRTRMIVNGSDAPWADWAYEFRKHLPRAIKKLIERSMPGDNETGESIRNRLEQVKELYPVSQYRRHLRGKYRVASSLMAIPGRLEGPTTDNHDVPSRMFSGAAQLRRRDNFSTTEKADAASARRAQMMPLPSVKWISVANGTRQPGDVEDRAAKFLPETHQIHINSDFRGFNDVVNYWERHYGAGDGPNPSRRAIIVQILKGWYGQMLVEAVIGVLQLQGSALWTEEQIADALSEEALTAVVMQRFHLVNASRREIQTKLGKLIYEAVREK